MYRVLMVLALLLGLGGTSYLSWRGHAEDTRTPADTVESMEDGTGFPTPKVP